MNAEIKRKTIAQDNIAFQVEPMALLSYQNVDYLIQFQNIIWSKK